MSDTLYVATRKGLLTFEEAKSGWGLAGTAFIGEPVTALLDDERDGALYAALNLGHFGIKLHRSSDRGRSWTELGPPAFPPAPEPTADAEAAPSVELIWTLVPGGADRPGTLWAGTIPGGLFLSTDRGDSWSLVSNLWNAPGREKWMGGGYDNPGIHSVCVDPRDSARIAVGVSVGGVWMSADAGASWRLGGEGLRAAYMPPDQAFDKLVQDAHRLAACAADPGRVWCQHHNGIFRSDDGGLSFTEIETAKPSAFGFAVTAHPARPDTAWFVPAVKDECRVPVDHRLVVSRTDDGGKTFETLSKGLPPPPTFDLVYRHALDVDADGERLAMGSTTGNLWVGSGGGTSWTQLSAHLPPVNQVAWATHD